MNYELVQSSFEDWDQNIAALPQAHILQTREWAQVKSSFGWQSFAYTWKDEHGKAVAAAMVLQRDLSFKDVGIGRMLYIPKGPLLDWEDQILRRKVLRDLALIARNQGAIFIKIDPDVIKGVGIPGNEEAIENPLGNQVVDELMTSEWRLSAEQVQFRNTILIDLKQDLNTLLSNMKQKTRYNIRLAGRKGVTVRIGTEGDLPSLYRMYAETSVRDGFVIRSKHYYQIAWKTFLQAGMLAPLIAEVGGEMVAALMMFSFAQRAWYIYGMSSHEHREKMPNHLLQWEAIQHAKANDNLVYDLWGAPDEFTKNDPMWGVYRFKSGFGGQIIRHIGAWDLPCRPVVYHMYAWIMPRLMEFMRRKGKANVRRALTN